MIVAVAIATSSCRHPLPMPDLNRALVVRGAPAEHGDAVLATVDERSGLVLSYAGHDGHREIDGIIALGLGRQLMNDLFADRFDELCQHVSTVAAFSRAECLQSVRAAAEAFGTESGTSTELVVVRKGVVTYERRAETGVLHRPQLIAWSLNELKASHCWSELSVRGSPEPPAVDWGAPRARAPLERR